MNAQAQSPAEFIGKADAPIEAYSEFAAQLAELKQTNAAMVFDYEDAAGNKAARSHIFKLRKTKTAIEDARKAAKADALAYGRRVDSEAGALTEQLESMIEVHKRPLDEIEEREAIRVGKIKERLDSLEQLGIGWAGMNVGALEARLATLEATVIDESFAEFVGEAARLHDLALLRIKAELPQAIKREAEAKELAELRQMKVERDAQIAKEVAAKLEAERIEAAANAKAAQDKKAADERAVAEEFARIKAEERAIEAEAQAKAQAEASAKQLIEMQAKAEKDAADAVVAALAKAEAEQKAMQAAIAEEQAKREANKKHVATIHSDISIDIAKVLGNTDAAKSLCEFISQGKIRHLSINY
jgi:hypothetical protein